MNYEPLQFVWTACIIMWFVLYCFDKDSSMPIWIATGYSVIYGMMCLLVKFFA